MSVPEVDLAGLDAEALRRLFVELVLAREASEHVGRQNRLFHRIAEVERHLVAAGGGDGRELAPLLEHPAAAVRLAAAYPVRGFDRDRFIRTLEGLAGVYGEIGREARSRLERIEREQEGTSTPRFAPDPPLDPEERRLMDWQYHHVLSFWDADEVGATIEAILAEHLPIA